MNKKENGGGGMDPARVALLTWNNVWDLGIVVHEGFFLVAGAIAVGALAAAIANTPCTITPRPPG